MIPLHSWWVIKNFSPTTDIHKRYHSQCLYKCSPFPKNIWPDIAHRIMFNTTTLSPDTKICVVFYILDLHMIWTVLEGVTFLGPDQWGVVSPLPWSLGCLTMLHHCGSQPGLLTNNMQVPPCVSVFSHSLAILAPASCQQTRVLHSGFHQPGLPHAGWPQLTPNPRFSLKKMCILYCTVQLSPWQFR